MTTTTIRPASVQSDGFIRSDSASYATARGGYVAGTANNSTSPMTTGQRLNAGTHQLFEAAARMDCSSIAPGDTASAAVVELTKSANVGQMVYLMAGNAGAAVDSADYLPGSTIAAATKYGEYDLTGVANDATVQVTLNAAGLAAVQAAVAGAGFFSFYIVSKLFFDGTAPTGDERLSFHS